jgi:zinc/manganese transport system ATP-binding protein
VATRTGTRAPRSTRPLTPAVVEVDGLRRDVDGRTLWANLTFEVARGEWLAVLGPNGAGKTTLLQTLLGLSKPDDGRVRILGEPPASVRSRIGYVPQRRDFDRRLPLRGRDLVRLGLDGHRFGLARQANRIAVERALAAVDAARLGDLPVGRLSGGEQQRLRIAQAIVSEPALVLADEPLLSLDLAAQRSVVELLERERRRSDAAIVFVTHEINPVLPFVDRVLYLAGGDWAIGAVDDVLTTETLSELYRTDVDVVRVRDRIVVVGAPDAGGHGH